MAEEGGGGGARGDSTGSDRAQNLGWSRATSRLSLLHGSASGRAFKQSISCRRESGQRERGRRGPAPLPPRARACTAPPTGPSPAGNPAKAKRHDAQASCAVPPQLPSGRPRRQTACEMLACALRAPCSRGEAAGGRRLQTPPSRTGRRSSSSCSCWPPRPFPLEASTNPRLPPRPPRRPDHPSLPPPPLVGSP